MHTFEGKISLADTDPVYSRLQDKIFLQVSQTGPIQRLQGEALNPIRRARIFAAALNERIFTLLEGDEAGLLAAMVSGDKTLYSDDLKTAMSNSGTSHITAVSGLHISILVAFFTVFLGRRSGLFIAVPIIITYAVITGCAPSVMRAVIMTLVMICGFALRRDSDTLTSLSLALLILVAYNPFSITAASLTLSFGATLGIILFSQPIAAPLYRIAPKNRYANKVVSYIFSGIATSIAALVFTMPLMMIYFTRVSIVSVLSNILILWAVSLSLTLGIATLFISVFCLPAASFIARHILYYPLHYIVSVTKWIGGSGKAALAADSIYLALGAGLLIAIVIAAKKRKLLKAAPVLLLTGVFVLCFIMTEIEYRSFCEIRIAGEDGGAIIMARHKDSGMIINAGGQESDLYDIQQTWEDWGLEKIDTAVLTSDSYKNTWGVQYLSENMGIDSFYAAGQSAQLRDAGAMRYEESGYISFPGFTVELIKAEENYFSARIVGDNVTVLDICTIYPAAALASFEGKNVLSDILIVDERYIENSKTLARIIKVTSAETVIVCDDRFSDLGNLSRLYGVDFILMSQAEEVRIKAPVR